MKTIIYSLWAAIFLVSGFIAYTEVEADFKDDLKQLWIDAQLPDFADTAHIHRVEGTRSYQNENGVMITDEPMHILYLTMLINDAPLCFRWEPAKWTEKVPLEPVNAKDWLIENMQQSNFGSGHCWKGLRKVYGNCTVQSWRLLETRPLYFFPREKIEIMDPQTGESFKPIKRYKTVLLADQKVRVGDIPAETTKCIPPALHETIMTDYMPIDWDSVEDKTIRDNVARKVGELAKTGKIPTAMGVTMSACSCDG